MTTGNVEKIEIDVQAQLELFEVFNVEASKEEYMKTSPQTQMKLLKAFNANAAAISDFCNGLPQGAILNTEMIADEQSNEPVLQFTLNENVVKKATASALPCELGGGLPVVFKWEKK